MRKKYPKRCLSSAAYFCSCSFLLKQPSAAYFCLYKHLLHIFADTIILLCNFAYQPFSLIQPSAAYFCLYNHLLHIFAYTIICCIFLLIQPSACTTICCIFLPIQSSAAYFCLYNHLLHIFAYTNICCIFLLKYNPQLLIFAYRRYYDLISKFQIGLKSLLHQERSEPEFYGDLVYKLKKIVGSNNFSAQFIKIISHYKKIGYNINVLQQTAWLVVNPITVGNFAVLFNCILKLTHLHLDISSHLV